MKGHRLVELVQMFQENLLAQQLLGLSLLQQVLASRQELLRPVLASRQELLRELGPTLVHTLDKG